MIDEKKLLSKEQKPEQQKNNPRKTKSAGKNPTLL
jgi:hypothetical protein